MPSGFDKSAAAAAVIVALMLAAGERAQAQTPSPTSSAPVCIYESESYSEGAFLCIRKGLMLGCTASAGKVNWTVAADPTASSAISAAAAIIAPAWSAATLRPAPPPRRGCRRAAAGFSFGKVFCL